MPFELTNRQIFDVALEAQVGEHVVISFTRGEAVPSKLAARILHALLARDIDVTDLPSIGSRPLLCRAADDGPTTTGRLGRRDHGPDFFAHRRDH